MDGYDLFIEYAKADDQMCTVCTECISKGSMLIKLSDALTNGEYHHYKCFWSKSKYRFSLKSEDPKCPPFEGYESLQAKDKEKIVKSMKKLKETSNERVGNLTDNDENPKSSKSLSPARRTTEADDTKGTTENERKISSDIKKTYKVDRFMYELSSDPFRFAKIIKRRNKVLITINDYYFTQDTNSLHVCSSGVALTEQEWQKLGNHKKNINKTIRFVKGDAFEPRRKKFKSNEGQCKDIPVHGKLCQILYTSTKNYMIHYLVFQGVFPEVFFLKNYIIILYKGGGFKDIVKPNGRKILRFNHLSY